MNHTPVCADKEKVKKLFYSVLKEKKCSHEDYTLIKKLILNEEHNVLYYRSVNNNPFGKGMLKDLSIKEGEVFYLRKNVIFAQHKTLGLIKILGINTKRKDIKLYIKGQLGNLIMESTTPVLVHSAKVD